MATIFGARVPPNNIFFQIYSFSPTTSPIRRPKDRNCLHNPLGGYTFHTNGRATRAVARAACKTPPYLDIMAAMPRPKPLDILICLALLCAAALSAVPRGAGSAVRIEADGRVWLHDLSRDGTIEVEGPLGTTVVEISGGEARIVSSPCPGGTCMRGSASNPPDTLVCLPNRVIVTIEGEGGQIDAAAY